MVQNILIWLVSLKGFLCGCGADVRQNDFERGRKYYKVSEQGIIPSVINESSGLIRYDSLWLSHNDSGGKNEIYAFDDNLNLKTTLKIQNQPNKDWEAIASDSKNLLFIGDVGNNCNCRKDLSVIRYNLSSAKVEGVITYDYPDQKAFPPSRRQRNFDCEAMLFYKDSLYFFSKNRGKKMVHLYVIPNQIGHHTAILKDKIKINTAITDACINQEGTAFAILTYGKTLTFDIINQQINFQNPRFCIKSNRKLSEGIAYKGKDLFFTNESGKLFQIVKK